MYKFGNKFLYIWVCYYHPAILPLYIWRTLWDQLGQSPLLQESQLRLLWLIYMRITHLSEMRFCLGQGCQTRFRHRPYQEGFLPLGGGASHHGWLSGSGRAWGSRGGSFIIPWQPHGPTSWSITGQIQPMGCMFDTSGLGNDHITDQEPTAAQQTEEETQKGSSLTFQIANRLDGRFVHSVLQDSLPYNKDLPHLVKILAWSSLENISVVAFILKNQCFW